MEEYTIHMKVTCYYDVTVKANSFEEAKDLAWDAADFGNAYDVDCEYMWEE